MKKLSVSLAFASLFILATAQAGTLVEKFNTDPSLDGWQAFGDTNLFQWDSTNQVLDVTWDSTQPNSYYYHPLGVTLTITDGFCVVFDLQVNDAVAINSGSRIIHWTTAFCRCHQRRFFSRRTVLHQTCSNLIIFPSMFTTA